MNSQTAQHTARCARERVVSLRSLFNHPPPPPPFVSHSPTDTIFAVPPPPPCRYSFSKPSITFSFARQGWSGVERERRRKLYKLTARGVYTLASRSIRLLFSSAEKRFWSCNGVCVCVSCMRGDVVIYIALGAEGKRGPPS